MARIRSVKPSLRTSRVVAQWPMEVRYFWVLLWGYLDDLGRGDDIPKAVAGDCFPLDDAVTPAKVDRWLNLIASSSTGDRNPPLCRYIVAGARYLHAVNWKDHQRPNRPSPSRIPPCPLHEPSVEERSEPSGGDAVSPQVLEVGSRKLEVGGGSGLTEPPPRCCPNHPNGTPDACGPCGDARRAHEAWEAEKRARVEAEPDCPRHIGWPASNCGACRSEQIAAA
jgi:hypothetical protein